MQQIHEQQFDGLQKLTGVITNLKSRLEEAEFFFTEADKNKFGAIAIASAAVGAAAEGLLAAQYSQMTEEQADYVEFELDGKPCKGWLWRNPFQEGDKVEVAAEWQHHHYEVFAVKGVENGLIALYPHCSRGGNSHRKNAFKWWCYIGIGLIILYSLSFIGPNFVQEWLEPSTFIVVGGAMAFFALMVWSLTRQWMPFAKLAQQIFTVLEFKNPSMVDLEKTTKQKRKDNDSPMLGTFFFRY